MDINFRLLGCPIVAAMIGFVFNVLSTLAAAPSAGDVAFFERLDADKDQQVTAAELPPEHGRLFARLLRRGDGNGDEALTLQEFLAALVPTRPEKPLEVSQSASPQADAVRYLLLSMDTSRNSSIEADEVPDDMRPVFDVMLERLDTNKNDTLDRFELSRGFPALAQISGRYAAREGLDVAQELRKLEKSQGGAADRFEQQRPLMENLSDPSKARETFTQLDANGDGKIESEEVPEPFRPQLERLLRFADRDRDERLSEREFLKATERLSRFRNRRPPAEMPERESKPPAEAMPEQPMPAESR